MFKKASKLKLRFNTTFGIVSAEDLWDLSLEDLDEIAKELSKTVKANEEESFIGSKNMTRSKDELRFEIVKDVIKDKLEARDVSINAKAKRATKARILEIIESKKDQAMGEKSIEDLQAELDGM